MNRIAIVLLALVWAAPARASLPYDIDMQTVELAGSCASAGIVYEGAPFFDVNALPIPCYTKAIDSAVPPQWSDVHGPFDSIFLRAGSNTIDYGISTVNNSDYCTHSRHVVKLLGTSAGALPLFDVVRVGTAFTGSTTINLQLNQIDPQLANDIARWRMYLAMAEADVLATASSAEQTAKKLDRLTELQNDIDDLLSKGFDALDPAVLDAVLTEYADVGPEVKAALEQLVADLKKDVQQYRDEIAQLVSTFAAQADAITDGIVTGGARGHGFDPNNGGNYKPNGDTSNVPDVPVPQLGSDPFDETHDPYALYADSILGQLDGCVSGGEVKDRSKFQSVVRGWRDNQRIVEKALSLRAGISQKEWGAFLHAQSRVIGRVHLYMDDHDWFKDAPIPDELKGLVDGLLLVRMANQQRAVKEGLNLWYGPQPTPQQQLVIDALLAILDGGVRSFDEATLEDPQVPRTMSKVLDGAVVVIEEVGKGVVYLSPVGPFISVCEIVTGQELCNPWGRPMSNGERVLSGAMMFGGKIIWKAIGKVVKPAGKWVSNKLAAILGGFGDIALAERKLLIKRLAAKSITELGDLTGKELKLLLDVLEDPLIRDKIINELAPALKGAGLKELREFKGVFKFATGGALDLALQSGKGAAALGLPALKRQGIGALRAKLTAAGFRPYAGVAGGGQEIWMHADQSLVRITKATGTKVRPYYHFKKEITNAVGVFDQPSVLAKITDGGAIVPEGAKGLSGAVAQLESWFRNKLSRAPTASELDALGNAWGVSSHIPIDIF